MKSFTFNSAVEIDDEELPRAEDFLIKQEPMLFRCDWEHAAELGGPLTTKFLSNLPDEWKYSEISVDSRVHMLMPGWFPCIPGWHHDDVPRERCDGQPNYVNPSYRAKHAMALWGDASLTEFASGIATFPDIPVGGVFYRAWHPMVEEKLGTGELTKMIAPERRIVFFDWETWHQGKEATKSGWRFFIRATRDSLQPPKNEIRHNCQVYMPAPMAGW